MKLALHRSLIFWSGLLVMAFFCWAWRDSEHLWTKAGKGPYVLHNGWGGLLYGITTSGSFGSGFHFERNATGDFKHSPETFPKPFLLRAPDVPKEEPHRLLDRLLHPASGEDPTFTVRELMTFSVGSGPSHSWILFIPHWLILLTFAALWLSLLFWRAKRRSRTTKGIAG